MAANRFLAFIISFSVFEGGCAAMFDIILGFTVQRYMLLVEATREKSYFTGEISLPFVRKHLFYGAKI